MTFSDIWNMLGYLIVLVATSCALEKVDALLNIHSDACDVVNVLCYHSYCSGMMSEIAVLLKLSYYVGSHDTITHGSSTSQTCLP